MKLTLDNPAVLEQKLEALEHHKKVLENQQQRRLQLQHKGQESAYGRSNAYRGDGVGSNGSKIYENQSRLYENMKSNEPTYGSLNKSAANYSHDKRNDSGLVYSNIMHDNGRNGNANKADTRNPYSNMSYEGNLQGLSGKIFLIFRL